MSTPTDDRLGHAIATIGPLDARAMVEASSHLDRLTKPPGSLGRLEELSIQLAGITGLAATRFERRVISVFAADHGVALRGVSAYPSDVTAQMVANITAGGAAINALAGVANAAVVVIDVGVASPIPMTATRPHRASPARFISAPVRAGSRDLSTVAALEADEVMAAIDVGLDIAETLHAEQVALVGIGEMGIGNTTAASAVVATLTGRPVRAVTGRGTGADDATFERKLRLIGQALERTGAAMTDPLLVLAEVGGLEIAALVGFIIGSAARKVPVVLDGFITSAAALIASRLSPTLPRRLIASHRSPEPGHRVILEELGLDPLLDLGMRLGEGTGAALAMSLIDASCRVRDGMATFESAQVTGPVTPTR